MAVPLPHPLPPRTVTSTTSYFQALVGLGLILFALIRYPDLGRQFLVPRFLGRTRYPTGVGSFDHCGWEGQDSRGPLVLTMILGASPSAW